MQWIERLPDRLETSLQRLLDSVENHEESYMEAQNASVGQIWVGMASMNQRLEKMEDMVKAHRKALRDADIDVDRHLDSDLEDSLKNY